MIRNYLKIALRNISRHKSFAFLNVFGLAIGMAACILLFIVVRYESSYDNFLPGNKQIYRIVTEDKTPEETFYTPGVPFPALDALRIDMPQLKVAALFSSFGSQITVLGANPNAPSAKKYIEETGVFFAEPAFFQVFPYTFVAGTAAVLGEPGVTVLTKKMAEKYFGNWKEAVGQYLRIDNAISLKVGGIIEDVPANSDFPLAVVSSFISIKDPTAPYQYTTDWGSTTSNMQIYARAPANVAVSTLSSQLTAFSKKVYRSNPDNVRSNFLQPLSDIHFDTRVGNMGDHTISRSTLWTLSLIGVFIIIMACINFINLSTAQAINRSREIGVRKVLGGRRIDLFSQMMGETGVIVFISMLVALLLAAVCLPFISHVASINETLTIFTTEIILFTLVIGLLVTILAGCYPSLVLSGFTPMLAIKNKVTSASVGGISLRRGLVVLQFTISQVLVIGTVVAISQMSFVRNADLGFNREAVLVMNANSDSVVYSRQEALKQELLALNGVKTVSFSSDMPSSENNWGSNFAYDHRPDEKFTLYLKFADEDYFKTFGLEFAAGKGYSRSDTIRDVVINEALLARLGVKDPKDAIGKELRMGGGSWKTITGVVKDFKTNSLREETKPLMLAARRRTYSNMSVKINSGNIVGTRDAIQKKWDAYFPDYATRSFFMDESVENFYRQENQLSLLYKIFAGIAILISCLGLYGLVSFMAVQRTKEVGIRKVLGASVGNIIYLFSKEFTILIMVAFLLAAPLAWYLMNNWLSNFAYRIPLGAGIFIIAAVLSMIIAWMTVGYKSMRAATVSPVKSLKSE